MLLFFIQISSDDASRSPIAGLMQQRSLNLSSPGPGQSSSLDCPVCYNKCAAADFYLLLICNHFACRVCLVRYLMIEILESRTDIGEIFMRTSFSCNVIKLFII